MRRRREEEGGREVDGGLHSHKERPHNEAYQKTPGGRISKSWTGVSGGVGQSMGRRRPWWAGDIPCTIDKDCETAAIMMMTHD